MTPGQFISRVGKRQLPAACLFLGPDAYQRRRCREALMAAALGDGGRENGLAEHDLAGTSLAAVIDDARALSLFASDRIILVYNAEAALPRVTTAGDDVGDGGSAGAQILTDYMRDPSPGVVLVFDAPRFDFEGDDKRKLDRVRKFYSAVRDVVEMRRADADEARAEAQSLAGRAGVSLDAEALDLLVESLGADLARIAVEIEKLALFSGGSRPATVDDVAALVPDARATTIFALVNALGRRDRTRALGLLDTLSREGEYLPLALAFLSTQFRLALAAREAGLRSPQQVQAHFTRLGMPMWGSRAEQVCQTLGRFSQAQLQRALKLIFETDKGLRSARPDDRVVMEQFVMRLTA